MQAPYLPRAGLRIRVETVIHLRDSRRVDRGRYSPCQPENKKAALTAAAWEAAPQELARSHGAVLTQTNSREERPPTQRQPHETTEQVGNEKAGCD
jgi:hypothetical protein